MNTHQITTPTGSTTSPVPEGPTTTAVPAGPAASAAPVSEGLAGVPLALTALKRRDFVSDQEVRWCPGCGDYSILSTFQAVLPELGIARENAVVISGIGCSSRFPYYMNAYGMHSIHGRAPAIATGVAIARPDLAVFVMTGDGDALSIGGNHLIHAMRRNINLTIILFNNEIYGLTKGQYSPTSAQGLVTKSSPMGSVDYPFNPLSVALGAGCTFVGRAIDSDRKGLDATLRAAAKHRGTSFVEVFQNCPIFNDGAYRDIKGPDAADHLVRLADGEPVLLGADGSRGVVRDPVSGALTSASVEEVGIDHMLVHDSHREDPSLAFELSHLTDSGQITQTPIGIFRDVVKPAYDDMVRDQLTRAAGDHTSPEDRDDALQALLNGVDNWTVTEDGQVIEN